MTCIVGLIDNKNIYMGGDSAGVCGSSMQVRSDPKVFIKGEFIMGFTSSFRMGELLQYNLILPTHHAGVDTYEYMVTSFVDAVRECLKKGGYARKENDTESGGKFLIGYDGRIFCIESDYQVGETINHYNSCGCGSDIALGAMYVSEGISPKDRILKALEAAEQFSSGVRSPFRILKLPKQGKR